MTIITTACCTIIIFYTPIHAFSNNTRSTISSRDYIHARKRIACDVGEFLKPFKFSRRNDVQRLALCSEIAVIRADQDVYSALGPKTQREKPINDGYIRNVQVDTCVKLGSRDRRLTKVGVKDGCQLWPCSARLVNYCKYWKSLLTTFPDVFH